ncbi:MAG: hypothetical protein CO186_01035 [Zetaproteobacteria bacterium CG_4_9_14_3_um_filter_49_83]|nr:MAG: hypothetical protein AUJ56_02370 [Zetaproteobacteria bacterium CG1_02_49_23]PIQ30045.1 MAG: hypothetical protein COW62_13610 [Zetaproteobacteria bacterium CG17_big_fil_post_rev_8_21_14_2_50_50_13]PIV29213.1 MAG: hypothetical protein COS35_13320 [Zetaproteobacteria bacterium CG02_land_8_20_14_3_00_50_9]PIY56007.1 MAG: hypothetical protein COZ00_06665 [Zetaproteobacteria bacterium CG_4_10_14_0_8_um_filter_49_80]PJA36317.1 MAG: hypothetical protein CO186_01035 [Zetaproteobacteria bacterium
MPGIGFLTTDLLFTESNGNVQFNVNKAVTVAGTSTLTITATDLRGATTQTWTITKDSTLLPEITLDEVARTVAFNNFALPAANAAGGQIDITLNGTLTY